MRFTSLSMAVFAASSTVTKAFSPKGTSDTTITLSNKITACPDKVAEEQQLLITFLKQVREDEAGVLKFLLYLAPNSSTFLTFEIYADQAAIDKHLSSSYFNDLIAAEAKDKTKCAENQVLIPLEEVFGFARHDNGY
ncbi:hypothetical protein AMS68_001996 [Peltaster fructicola]|uniref:ABM domain-containing protein n=1 Tax=Peltaster fructicola TaxID=286661 RepID=A0A6H0XPD3_9PEZI|nr:hypothetical protein AMS68_001996 [Peltaster fructicola]